MDVELFYLLSDCNCSRVEEFGFSGRPTVVLAYDLYEEKFLVAL